MTLRPQNGAQITLVTSPTYDRWYEQLRDGQARRRIDARIERLQRGNPGDVRTVGEGVSEMRVHYGPGYRVYFVRRGRNLVVLLAGGDKSTQAEDIRIAQALARDLDIGRDL